ncbi:MAG: alanine:cation symporter family protein [Bacteroidales bacterium]|nr:alanine:cation symporter family protein [Bacteroidales bacterium]
MNAISEFFANPLEYIQNLSDFLWTYIIIALLVGCAIIFTILIRGAQFLKLGEMMRLLFTSGKKTDDALSNGKKSINSFQAFAVSLSSRVGTGNLAGVASAICIGGPGAVFWMWVMALFGAATAFFEATLAQLFKRKGEDSFYGGPAYYMQHGLHSRWMGILFAFFIIYTFGMANQVTQSNTLCDAVSAAYNSAAGENALPPISVAIGLTLLTFGIIFGGIQRISKFAAMVVPFMAIGYLLLAIYILGTNISEVPHMFKLIVSSAFGAEQAAGGMVGMAIMQGVKRGLFSNEAGEGSAPNAAATASISHPVKQGLLQSFGVFTDTIIICTCTAFVIILSGIYDNGEDGINLTSTAMQHHLGDFGRWFLTAAIFLFAYSTIIANYFYGETNIRFITKKEWAVQVFRFVTGFTVLAGGFMTLQQTWALVDLGMALMTLINLISIILLSRWVVRLYKDYFRQRKEGKDPVFRRSTLAEIQDDIECWEE